MPDLTPAQRSNFLPVTAWGYAWWRAHSLSLLSGEPFSLTREACLFQAICAPQAEQHWLDAGTSAGFYAGVLARAGCRVTAADLSTTMLRVAAQRERAPLIAWERVNIEQNGWPDGSFDGVKVGATLNETAHPDVFLHQLERVLKPGGHLWLMFVPATGGLGQRGLSRLGGLFFPDPSWVERHLPRCTLVHAFRVGRVQFMALVRS
ncbi:class I SAM-dependent methyltransferase [Deinococcus fonticola]|uniref:class I SAM-dependent methyltransferase n=1 Tax=Deinococcus fonticola TaxID=2528713 RepID=UPI0010752105|nr:class I SAM-dependent methyltransferase [Deinococcus fonticola]